MRTRTPMSSGRSGRSRRPHDVEVGRSAAINGKEEGPFGPCLCLALVAWRSAAVGSWFGIVLFLPEAVASLPVAGRRLASVMERIAWVPATVVAALLLIAAADRGGRGNERGGCWTAGTGSRRSGACPGGSSRSSLPRHSAGRDTGVVENSKAGADGGVDVRLCKDESCSWCNARTGTGTRSGLEWFGRCAGS